MANPKLSLARLQKQQRQLNQDPIPHVIVARKGLLHFHFLIFGLDGQYQGGFYHAVLQLHEDYPFSPPRLLFYTPSGRFQTGKPICTSFTNFHKQTWTAGWNVRTMIIATISFMTSQQHGVGGLKDNYFTRKSYAQKSWSWNMKNSEFRELFQQRLREHSQTKDKFLIHIDTKSDVIKSQNSKNSPQTSNCLYFLYIALFIVIFMWLLVSSN